MVGSHSANSPMASGLFYFVIIFRPKDLFPLK